MTIHPHAATKRNPGFYTCEKSTNPRSLPPVLTPSPIMHALRIACIGALLLGATPSKADDQADIVKASRGAETFINDYLSTIHGSYEGVLEWVDKRQDVYPIFKERLSKLYRDALKLDPECGYGADAILAGVDEVGTKYQAVDTFYGRAHITVTLQAVAPEGCKHQVQVVMMQSDGGNWKVQSCGDVPM